MVFEKNKSFWKSTYFVILLIALSVYFVSFVFATPNGAAVTAAAGSTATANTSGTNSAQGGFVTNLNLSGETQSNFWQGYWGRVTGNITLKDSSGNVFYRWAWDNTDGGEIFASETASPTWTAVTALTNRDNINFVGGDGPGRDTSDSANDTFLNNAFGTFAVVNKTITGVPIVNTSNSSGQNTFTMGVINDSGTSEIFVATLYNGTASYKYGEPADFQIMVPTNETGATSRVTYNFFVELK